MDEEKQLQLLAACADERGLQIYADWLEERGGRAGLVRSLAAHPQLDYAGPITGLLGASPFGLLSFRSHATPERWASEVWWALLPGVGPAGPSVLPADGSPVHAVELDPLGDWILLRARPQPESVRWHEIGELRWPWRPQGAPLEWTSWLAIEPSQEAIWLRHRYDRDADRSSWQVSLPSDDTRLAALLERATSQGPPRDGA